MDETYNDIFWINFANEISELREKERQKLPYNFNLMYELRADENAHTRLMLNLLNYNETNVHPFFPLPHPSLLPPGGAIRLTYHGVTLPSRGQSPVAMPRLRGSRLLSRLSARRI